MLRSITPTPHLHAGSKAWQRRRGERDSEKQREESEEWMN